MKVKYAAVAIIALSLGWPAARADQPKVKVTPLLKTTTTITGQKITYPAGTPQVTALSVEIPPGVDVGWHQHPNIRYVYVIEGTLTIEWENGTRKEFPAGSFFVEAVNTPHHGMNLGATPVRVLFVDHSEEGQANVVALKPPGSAQEASHPGGYDNH
jgi:quercetin dioxygenase-like cupin family protein